MRLKALYIYVFFILSTISAQSYRALEVREVTRNPKANGETDFKGETEIFNTDQRIKYLTRYADVAGSFFGVPELNKQPVSILTAKQAVESIKPQPLPSVRKKVILSNWKYIGYSAAKNEREKNNLAYWKQQQGVSLENGWLLFKNQTNINRSFETIDWRGKISLIVKTTNPSSFSIGLSSSIEIKNLKLLPNQWQMIEIDFDNDENEQGYNVFVDGTKVIDYAPLKTKKPIDNIKVSASKGTVIDEIVVTKFGKKIFGEELHDRDEPYSITTVLDETFELTPSPEGSSTSDYDETAWKKADEMPFAYGGERFKEERLYLRNTFNLEELSDSKLFENAILNIEAISPTGEVWVNGTIVHLSKKPVPVIENITKYLRKGLNTILIVVDPKKVEHFNRHTAADYYTGWYAGRVWIDFRSSDYVQDPYVITQSIEKTTANVLVNFCINSERWLKAEREVKIYNGFKGSVEVALYDWFPLESKVPIATVSLSLEVELYENKHFSLPLNVLNAKLWSVEKPQLYKAVITLKDENGKAVDDIVLTTGLRVISQDGGTFRINGKPSMMNGALILGHRLPIENIARHMYCAPSHIVMQDILKIKAMNGNAIRMSHHDEVTGGTNDARYAEYADQLGLMYQWATPAWVRSGSPYQLDIESLPQYVKQLRNHPSIVLWQPANHPKVGPPMDKAMKWFGDVYQAIYQTDSSRLITPTANQIRMNAPSDDGTLTFDGKPVQPFAVWTAPMIARGNMDFIIGYGANWEKMRAWPASKKWDGEQGWQANANRDTYINSPGRAYFDFENEESIGQHNWNLQKGKPEYKIMSYELDMDEGSIGKLLTTNQWRESQAWQAMSAFEAIKKKRLLDYDGFAWCELNGGGNSGTYLKPLLDYYDHAKLAYYAVGMAYQPTFACSGNVDMAYGEKDSVNVVVVHCGDEIKANVKVLVKNAKGKTVMKKEFPNVSIAAGRINTKVGSFSTAKLPEGTYSFEYTVIPKTEKK